MKNKARTSKPRPATRPRSQSSSTRRAAPGRTAGKSIASGKSPLATRKRAVGKATTAHRGLGRSAMAAPSTPGGKGAAGKSIASARSARATRPADGRATKAASSMPAGKRATGKSIAPATPAPARGARGAVKLVASAKQALARGARAAVELVAAAKRALTPARKGAADKPSASRKSASARSRRKAAQGEASRWLTFVEQHGVVLASARGPVPSVAEAVAGQPIVGSWWAHPKGRAIFAALSELDDSDDVRCFKLVDGKVTFVHRRVWPALTRLASDGVLAAARVASIQQEHMPTGEHRNLVTPFPDWVPDDVARAATTITVEDARAQLGAWI